MRNQIEFEKGEFLVREYEEANCAFVIVQGEVGVFKQNAEGQIIPLGIIKPGEYLGELGIVSGQTRSAEAVALTKVIAIRISRELLEIELAKMPSWVSALMNGLVERLQRTDELLRKNHASDPTLKAKILPAIEEALILAGKDNEKKS